MAEKDAGEQRTELNSLLQGIKIDRFPVLNNEFVGWLKMKVFRIISALT